MFSVERVFEQKLPKFLEYSPKFFSRGVIGFFQKLFHEKKFQQIHEKNHYMHGLEFVEDMIEQLDITYTVKPKELKNIPSTGALIVVANHITGGSDAFTLTQLIANAREDKKVRMMVNGMLMGMEQAHEMMIPVDNIGGSISRDSLRKINESLKNEEALIIFPAGIVSRLGLDGIMDFPWQPSFLKIARKHKVPILPVKIDGRNSKMFYFLSLFLPRRFTAMMLAHEFITASQRMDLVYNIGRVIPPSAFSDESISDKEYMKRFYTQLYNIGKKEKNPLKTEVTITKANNIKVLKAEIEMAQKLGHTQDGKLIVLAESKNAPFLMQELGRVREVSFRAIGGGTGGAKDNDLYDNYYKHLVLWDEEELEVVGAYRIGEVSDIIEHRGMQGLYTYNQCEFSDEFSSYTKNSVELGRSFVQPKYWGSRALDNLWQGVGAYLANNPQIVYTYGIVTINADTPRKAVAALVYFYSHHFSCESKMMSAKEPYFMSYDDKVEFDELFKYKSYKDGFVALKKYLKELNTSVPTLFKQYAELYDEGAVRFFDFSVNEKLHGVVEGFIIADNSRMKEAKRKRYIKNFELENDDEQESLKEVS